MPTKTYSKSCAKNFGFLNRYLNALLMFLYENPSTASPSTTESKAETPSGFSEFNLTVSSGKSKQKAHQLALKKLTLNISNKIPGRQLG